MDKIGRKKTNLAAAFPCLLSWGLLYLTANDDVLLLYFARFLAGISGGNEYRKDYYKMLLNSFT